jgi:hypothetical protein
MIDEKKWYSVKEIREQHLLPMFKPTNYSIKKWIEAKKLKAIKTGTGNGKRYKIKGNWLIEFIAKWESGDFHA